MFLRERTKCNLVPWKSRSTLPTARSTAWPLSLKGSGLWANLQSINQGLWWVKSKLRWHKFLTSFRVIWHKVMRWVCYKYFGASSIIHVSVFLVSSVLWRQEQWSLMAVSVCHCAVSDSKVVCQLNGPALLSPSWFIAYWKHTASLNLLLTTTLWTR